MPALHDTNLVRKGTLSTLCIMNHFYQHHKLSQAFKFRCLLSSQGSVVWPCLAGRLGDLNPEWWTHSCALKHAYSNLDSLGEGVERWLARATTDLSRPTLLLRIRTGFCSLSILMIGPSFSSSISTLHVYLTR